MTKVKELPILFRPDMASRIYSKDKTETRRSIKPVNGIQPVHDKNFGLHNCPYGKEGDRLWVKESWRVGAWKQPIEIDFDDFGFIAVDYLGDNFARKEWLKAYDREMFERLVSQSVEDAEKANAPKDEYDYFVWEPGNSPCRWRPSMFMPRWASRTDLVIRMVDIERVQMIGPYGIEAEGLRSENPNATFRAVELKEKWIHLWNKINAKPRPVKTLGEITHYNSFPWDGEDADPRTEINSKPHYCFPNPWVWVIKFKRIEL